MGKQRTNVRMAGAIAVLLVAVGAVYGGTYFFTFEDAVRACSATPSGEQHGDSTQVSFAPNPLPNFKCHVDFPDGSSFDYYMGWNPKHQAPS
ncbi:hypothetical protein [Zhihengliuella halotolerans]|uniref:hypothetical protein n=1 Tax=Zhihengliuella halotolerans TaxID=370736 RepID=UPI0011AF4A62|nr:hypothetical protein [Zhihengliuella halotolerans]